MLRQEVVHAVDIEMTQMSFEAVARSRRLTQQSAMIVAARCHLWFGFWVRSCRPFVDIGLYSSAACVLHIACVFAEEGVGEKRTPLQASFRVGIFVRVRRGGGGGMRGRGCRRGGAGEGDVCAGDGRALYFCTFLDVCARQTGVHEFNVACCCANASTHTGQSVSKDQHGQRAASILAQKYAPSLCFGFVTESGDRFEFGEDASHALA